MPLTSPHNPQLVELRRAVANGRPTEGGLIAAEGPHLLGEALKGRWSVERVFFSTEARERQSKPLAEAARRSIELVEIATRAFRAISQTEENQGVLSLLKPQEYGWDDVFQSRGPVLVLDGIQDPGNAGAIFRSTEAFGGGGVLLARGSVRVSNGKFLRAASGSVFRLPFIENQDRDEIVRRMQGAERTLFALTMNGNRSVTEVDFKEPFALVVGSEGLGISEAMLNGSITISIPTTHVESLNAAVACSVALFEAARQLASRPA